MTAYIPSKTQPGQELAPITLYAWYGRAAGDVAHAFRGGPSGFLRSVCNWQRWTITSISGAGLSHCRDCTAVVEYELEEARVSLIDPAAERRHRAAVLADEADWTTAELAEAYGR